MKPSQLPENEVIGKFIDAMAAAGLRCGDDIEPDGEIHRFHVDGDPKPTKNGFYVLFLDGIPAGQFGSWKSGLTQNWCAKGDSEMSREEIAEVTARIEQAKHERAERDRMKHEATAAEAVRLWNDAHDADAHPYLVRKGVQSHGLRVGRWPTGVQALMVPIQDASGHLVSLQAIFENVNPRIGRDKDFLAGGKKRGCWFSIGMHPIGAQTIVLCEGYATGATLFEATGMFTVVAFDAGNLESVAHELRRRWPQATILIAADHDRWTVPTEKDPNIIENPGVTFAKKIATSMPARVLVAIPEFSDLDTKPTDFNDLARLDGMDAVKEQIAAVLPKPETPANDNEPNVPLDAVVAPFGFPHVSDKGMPLDTVENLAFMLDEYGIRAKYNVISKDVEITIPRSNFSRDNHTAVSLTTISSLCARNRVPRGSVMEYVLSIADANEYNPAADWIDSKPWDGVDRLEALAASLDPQDASLAIKLLRRWMIGAVGAAYERDGMSMQGALVLQGAQNAGKTTWFWQLTGGNKRLGKEGVSLNPSDRDSVKGAISHWLVELGELDATFKKADIAALKSFITKDTDELFLRYSRAISTFPRRTAFFGTVNPAQYLHDDTGNRRYWTVRCGDKLNAMHGIDMQQAWAQVKTFWLAGEQHRLTRDEMDALNEANNHHTETNPIEEMILSHYDWNAFATNSMSATDVLVAIGYDKPNNKQAKDTGAILRKLTGAEPKKTNGRSCFLMPPAMRKGRFADADDDRPI